MANFDSGVSGYVSVTVPITVHFPIDSKGNADICCMRCPYLSSNERVCQLNKQLTAYPHKYVGDNCPFRNQIEEGESE